MISAVTDAVLEEVSPWQARPLEAVYPLLFFVALRVISAVIMVATSLALAYEAFVKIETEWGRLSAAMHVPMGVLYLFALVGFLSAAIHSAFKIPYANRPERKLDIGEMEG